MNELAIPELFKGHWQHAVLLTYGADIPLFENALLRQFAESCRNKVILADGHRFLNACQHYARPGVVRHLNQRYVADGILVPHAAHGKAILLVNESEGRLLVGSGNLGMQGYASGGELFTQYNFKPDAQEHLNAFIAIRELLEKFVQKRYVGRAAIERIKHLTTNTPWLYWHPVNGDQPVRHNLELDFLTQLAAEIGDDPVEELWVLSPFFDPSATALDHLLNRLRPQHTMLLLQPNHVSLKPSTVDSVLRDQLGQISVHPIERDADHRYIHAKLYLIKTADRAICLQGSPNLSQVAFLRVPPYGNIELANLQVGERNAFDYLLDALDIGPEVDSLEALNIEPFEDEDETSIRDASWYLTRAELDGDVITLHFHGTAPNLDSAAIEVAGEQVEMHVKRLTSEWVKMTLDATALARLERAVPLTVVWSDTDGVHSSNPVFVHNLTALNRTLAAEAHDGDVDGIGDLNLDDEEFEHLLGELKAILVLDREDVWQMAGRQLPDEAQPDDDGPLIPIEEIDYARIRQHPKIQQYLRGPITATEYGQTRLQRILTSITDHFRGLVDPKSVDQAADMVLDAILIDQAETEEEVEQAEEEHQKRRWGAQKRVRRILINFIERYLRGIQSKKFQVEAGSAVMTQNYVIFSHLLWRLFAKDWIEPTLVLEYLHDVLRLYWGDGTEPGYWTQLSFEECTASLEMVADHHSNALMMAAFYHGAYILQGDDRDQCELNTQLRDQWRVVLCSPHFRLSSDLLEASWYYVASIHSYEPPRPTQIALSLANLANSESRDDLLRSIDSRLQLAEHSCRMVREIVNRVSLDRADDVMCLQLSEAIMHMEQELAVELLRRWMRAEPNLNYYRVATHGHQQMAYYDGLEPSGVYWDKLSTNVQEIEQLKPWTNEWDTTLANLMRYSNDLDSKMTLPVANISAQIYM